MFLSLMPYRILHTEGLAAMLSLAGVFVMCQTAD